MKKTLQRITALLIVLITVFAFVSCESSYTGVWENATCKTDTEIGEGSKTVIFEVEAEEKTITFTVHTDKTILGDALLDNNLIAGDAGPYGLYVKTVNGITADYDVDKSYWMLYIDGEMAMTGVDGTEITEGAVYKFAYTK